jgi:bifunctional non-homologous end joining protein LigD
MALAIPRDVDEAVLQHRGRTLRVSALRKPFFPARGLTKGDLLRYYAAVAPALVPHLRGRAMVMRRFPDGVDGPSFYMKRAPRPRPDWVGTCAIRHGSGSVIDFPVVDDVLALLWLVQLGCVDLHPWYARCDDVQRPDWLCFDLDPGPEVGWPAVREAGLVLRDALDALGLPTFPKTTGATGLHVFVPLERGPVQKQVWTVAKTIALALAARHPALLTTEYRLATRPRDRVLVDYNQNAWGRTLASVYAVRPVPDATVSMPITWEELAGGVEPGDFRLETAPDRVRTHGDLWKPLLAARGRARLAEAA